MFRSFTSLHVASYLRFRNLFLVLRKMTEKFQEQEATLNIVTASTPLNNLFFSLDTVLS